MHRVPTKSLHLVHVVLYTVCIFTLQLIIALLHLCARLKGNIFWHKGGFINTPHRCNVHQTPFLHPSPCLTPAYCNCIAALSCISVPEEKIPLISLTKKDIKEGFKLVFTLLLKSLGTSQVGARFWHETNKTWEQEVCKKKKIIFWGKYADLFKQISLMTNRLFTFGKKVLCKCKRKQSPKYYKQKTEH